MARLVYLAATVFASSTLAYDQFYFTSEKSDWLCTDMPFGCPPPSACAYDAVLDKSYCCGVGDNQVCFASDAGCQGGQPASNQIPCSSGDNAFCCLKDREECTQRFNQINICWATPANPYAKLTGNQMNQTWSSLSSASPSASTWSFDPEKIAATSTPASTSTSASSTASSTATTTSSAASSSTTAASSASSSPTGGSIPGSNSGISGGAIAGIVIGVLAGLALLGAGAFFLFKRKNSKPPGTELDSNPYANNPVHNGYGAVAQEAPAPEKFMQQQQVAHEAPTNAPGYRLPAEMASGSQAIEMEGSQPHATKMTHRS